MSSYNLPNGLTTLGQMPSEWHIWHQRLCEVMELDFGAINSIRSSFLLIPAPAKHEIEETEANNLIEVVHNVLLENTILHMGVLRRKLLNLHPEASVPFLYAMRYIAFRDARKHSYWPSLTKSLFFNKLEHDQVALRLAPVSTTLWLRLYEYTGGKLYFPREGLRNIKWPLAHAGLLPEDKDVLKEFGTSLSEIDDSDTLTETIALETQEFILVLRDWLNNLQKHNTSRISQLMNGKGGEREVVAELAQQWLSSKRSELAIKSREGNHFINAASPSVRRLLAYDSQQNHVQLCFTLKRTVAPPVLQWNNLRLPFQIQFDSNTKEYVPFNLRTTLYESLWSSNAKLEIGDESYQVTVPTFEKGKGIIFDYFTGIRTTRWQFGQEYYLLIYKERFSKKIADQLFSEWISLGPPGGKWQEFDILYIRTRDPFSGSDIDLNQRDLVKLLIALEKRAEDMGLPSFGHEYRPKLRIIGGFSNLRSSSEFQTPEFTSDLPTYLEVHGVWKDELTIRLSKLEAKTGAYIPIDIHNVNPELAGSIPVIQLWQGQSAIGRYKITTEDDEEYFSVLDPESVDSEISRLELSLWFEDANKQVVLNPSRHAIDGLDLVIQAWPGADLTLEVSQNGMSLTTPIPVQLDSAGVWTNSVSNLPLQFANLHKGDLLVTVGWRGLYEQSARIADKEHLVFESIQDHDEGLGSNEIHCKGKIVGSRDSKEFFGCLFPTPPWGEQRRLFPIKVDDDGCFDIRQTGLDWQADWLAISDNPDYFSPSSNLLSFMRTSQRPINFDQSEIPENLLDVLQGYAISWDSLFAKLAEVSRPVAFEPYFVTSQFLSFLKSEFDLPSNSARWIFYDSWDDLAHLQKYMNYQFPMGLFSGARLSGRLPQIGVPVQLIFDSSLEDQERILASFDLNQKYQLDGWIFASENGKFRFSTLTSSLRLCSKCGQIMREDAFFGHKTHVKSMTSCTGIGASFETISRDDQHSLAVKVGVLLDPVVELGKFRRDLIKVYNRENIQDLELIEILKRLYQLVPASIDRGIWLEKLISTLEIIEGFLRQAVVDIYSLERASRLFVTDQAAVKLIFGSIKDRMMAH
jgi:hypothetical protein